MSINDKYWQTKIDALLCRVPGQADASGPEVVLRADRVAFALNQPVARREMPDWNGATIVHPLTGGSYPLHGMGVAEWVVAAKYIGRKAEDIRRRHPDSTKTQFLALWRLLAEPPDAGEIPDAVRRWWRLLPADPRTPAALLWEHQSLVSALAGTATPNGTLKPALLQFNIADTQAFVTRARRTQDLWAGSYLLSFLCWQLLKHFADTYGPDCIIQPLLRGQPLADLWLREEQSLGEVLDPGAGMGGRGAAGESRLLIANIPNIFTVLLPEDQVKSAVDAACEKMLIKWREISSAVRETFRKAAQCTGQPWQGCDEIWERQQSGFLKDNLFWAAVPLPAGPLTPTGLTEWQTRNGPFLVQTGRDVYASIHGSLADNPDGATGGLLYGLCSQLTARLLSDRKRTRDFEQVDEPGQKCSLSGALQAVYPTPLTSGSDLRVARDWWQSLAQFDGRGFKNGGQINMAGHIRRADRLCAIQATKRLMVQSYFENHHIGEPKMADHQFPSTAGIANARFIASVLMQAAQEPNVQSAKDGYAQAVKTLLGKYYYKSAQLPIWSKATEDVTDEFSQIDAECLYEEFYDRGSLEREFGEGLTSSPGFVAHLADAKSARNALMQALNGCAGRPSRYYAIIAMDGDSMGDWISGKKSNVSPGPALHLTLTSALSGFALKDARRIVETTHAGKLIYAGGDDVLALVPVSDLLPVMDALYRAYRGQEPGEDVPDGFVERDGIREMRMGEATLSAGVVIVHEATPLSYAVEQAREAEHDAKGRGGRDAFAVRLLKRSGAPVEIGAKWRAGGVDVPRAVLAAADLMRDGVLSSKIAYTMLKESVEQKCSGGKEVWPPEALKAAQTAEFRRLAVRHITGGNKEETLRRLAPLKTLVAASDPAGAAGSLKKIGWQDGWAGVQGLLRLARMIAEEA